jgi:biotin transporter BioY
MLVIYTGGWAQLALVSGDAAGALAVGIVPFIGQDLLKVCIAALVLWRGHHIVRPGA